MAFKAKAQTVPIDIIYIRGGSIIFHFSII